MDAVVAVMVIAAVSQAAWVLRTWIVCSQRHEKDDLAAALREIRPGRTLRWHRIRERIRIGRPEASRKRQRKQGRNRRK